LNEFRALYYCPAINGVARGAWRGGCGPHRAALARGGKRAKIVYKNSRENSNNDTERVRVAVTA